MNLILKFSSLIVLVIMLRNAWLEHADYTLFKEQGKSPGVTAWEKPIEKIESLRRIPSWFYASKTRSVQVSL